MKIEIVSSSTRRERLSHRIALALAAELEQRGVNAGIIDLQQENLALFEERYGHVEDPHGQLARLNERLSAAQGLIFLTPEYNGAITSSLKNFIDLFAKGPFSGKPIGVATGSTGALGGIRAAYQLQQNILTMNAYPQPQMLTVGKMDQVLTADGSIADPGYAQKQARFLDAYLGWVSRFVD